MDWQEIIVIAIVVTTVTVFLVRLAKPQRKASCGKDCGCGRK
jgi:hypothetical protein